MIHPLKADRLVKYTHGSYRRDGKYLQIFCDHAKPIVPKEFNSHVDWKEWTAMIMVAEQRGDAPLVRTIKFSSGSKSSVSIPIKGWL